MSAVPRVVVSAPSSGHGKTALAVGLLAAFAGRGLSAVGFKVGPDHTDAAYLGAAAGSPGRNLDPRLVGAHRVAPLFAHGAQGHDIAVVEGTMGLFDSLAGRVETDSTAGVAAALRAPVVMVVDVGAMGQSVAALVHGFRAYDELTWLGGVILNRVASDRHEQLLREALDDIGVPVYGALRRRDLPSALPPRQEGVVPVVHREVEALRGIRRLGESVAGAVDLDGLLALANSAPQLPVTPWSPAGELALSPDDTAAVHLGRRPVVALAGGAGISFSYTETHELLEAAGATVVLFDPLRDELLPESADGLVVGGALPEAYAEDLSANRRLCADIADLARSGRPVIAEGAGLLWLAQSFDGRPMCGVLDATGATGDQMIVGYRDATARATTAVAEVGTRVVGYKQHRGVVNPRSGQTPAWTWNGGTPEGFVWRRVHASQLALHWAGFPEIARRLVLAARPGEAPEPGGGGRTWARATGTVPVLGGAPAPASGGGLWTGEANSGEGTWPTAAVPVPVVEGPRPATPPAGAPASGDRARPAGSSDGVWQGARSTARPSDDGAWSGGPGPFGDARPASVGGALDYGTGPRDGDGFGPHVDDPADGRGFPPPAQPQLRSVPIPAEEEFRDSGGAPVSTPHLRAVPGSGGSQTAETNAGPQGPPRLRVVPPLVEVDEPIDHPAFATGVGDGDRAVGRGFAASSEPGGGSHVDRPARWPDGHQNGAGHADGRGFAPTDGPRADHDGASHADERGFAPTDGRRPPQVGVGPVTGGRGFTPPSGRRGGDEGAGYAAGFEVSGESGDEGGEYVTDGFGFAAVPGARAGSPAGDGWSFVVPTGGGQLPAGDGYRPPDQRQPLPEADPRRPAEFGFPVGRGEHPVAGSGFGAARTAAGQPAPNQPAGGALTGGTAEIPTVPGRAPHEPAAGRMRDDDGGIT
ncbi:cobyrinate a,c-diamide synthase [Asanoa sp. NPDC049573]|uniref:cobyrinate a,c-diamide synthase n=1 Tax=Asanoa sp. NPDC049573 TaxID=3155396 RepID=UPI00344298B5